MRRTGSLRGAAPAVRGIRTAGGIAQRMLLASVALALVVGACFAVLLLPIQDARNAERRALHSQDVLIAAHGLEQRVLDLETGQRGFILTRQAQFLMPWEQAREELPQRERALLELVRGDSAQEARVREIAGAARSYIDDYSVPLVNAAARGDPSAQTVPATAEGDARIGVIRADFTQLLEAERRTSTDTASASAAAAHRAYAGLVVGIGASIALVALYVGYLTRAIVGPIRRAATLAGRIAGGDLAARLPETGVGEVGALQRAFNVMGASLERGRDELTALADEQAGLRRVATLVAQGASAGDVLAAVAAEVGGLVPVDYVLIGRYDAYGGDVTTVARWSRDAGLADFRAQWGASVRKLAAVVRHTERPARTQTDEAPRAHVAPNGRPPGIRSSVGVPINVDADLWGIVIAASTREEPMPDATEARLGSFTELVSTAIANADAREELHDFAEEQSALRRVATLVARGGAPEVAFAAVAEEVAKVLPDIDQALVGRYTPDQSIEFVGGWSRLAEVDWVGKTASIGGHNVSTVVFETEQPARVDQLEDDATAVTEFARGIGARSSAGAPIKVDGQLWGVMIVGSVREEGLPAGVEHELAGFTELVRTAIANADGRAQLVAARRRVIEATDAARAKLARDIHDGAQQQFLTGLIDLQLAQQKRASDPDRSRELVDLGAVQVETGVGTLRELAAGLHPAILGDLGLKAALSALASRMPFPLSVEVDDLQLSAAVEASVYFFCSEALTNVIKHAAASTASLRVQAVDGELTVEVHDNGTGGAEFGSGGSGLIGLRDRIGALDGSLSLISPSHETGTTLTARIPLPD